MYKKLRHLLEEVSGVLVSSGKSILQLKPAVSGCIYEEPENTGEFVCNVTKSLENLVERSEKEKNGGSLDQQRKDSAVWG